MNELTAVKAADRAGFKYVWLTEHHFLDEYSHMSANDVVAGWLAHATERIHIGSGIFNPLPQVNHPAKVAERVAMLDHLSNGRFEFGTGRGAGSHEILGFLHREGITDTTATKALCEAVTEDRDAAVRSVVGGRMSYLQSNVYRYHDTFPRPDWVPPWPALLPDPDEETARRSIGAPGAVMGTPDDALQGCRDWEAAGADQ